MSPDKNEIGDILASFKASDNYNQSLDEALTAIYEIGLECIGADEDPKMEYNRRRVGFNRKYLNPVQTVHNPRITVRNELKASQRKAWAKACGVKDV